MFSKRALSSLNPGGSGEVRCPACGGGTAFMSVSEEHILPSDTRVEKKCYFPFGGGARYFVSAVTGGESKGSIHRPELCLPTQGYLLTDPRDIEVAGVPFRLLALRSRNAPPATFAYTFFNCDGFRTSSHVSRIWRDVCDRTFGGTLDGWAMVTVMASAPGGFDARNDPAALARLKGFLELLAPHLGGKGKSE